MDNENPYEIGQGFRKSMSLPLRLDTVTDHFDSHDRRRTALEDHARTLSIKPECDRHTQRHPGRSKPSTGKVSRHLVVRVGVPYRPPHRHTLLDQLQTRREPQNAGDLAERCQIFLMDVSRWRVLLDTYLTPLVDDAVRQVTLDAAISEQPQGPLSPDFPMRNASEDVADAEQGLSPRDAEGRSDAWSDIRDVVLPLPSSYVPDVLSKPSMLEPVTIEQNLRRIAADHALEDLRTALIGVGYFQLDKRSKQRKTHTTRAQAKIQTAQREADKAADEYRRHQTALLALGMESSDPRYQMLAPRDVVPFSMASDRSTIGRSRQRTSWIWENFVYSSPEEGDGNFAAFHEEGE